MAPPRQLQQVEWQWCGFYKNSVTKLLRSDKYVDLIIEAKINKAGISACD